MISVIFWIGPFLFLSLPTYKLGFSIESSSRAICICHVHQITQEAAVGGPCLCDSVLARTILTLDALPVKWLRPS